MIDVHGEDKGSGDGMGWRIVVGLCCAGIATAYAFDDCGYFTTLGQSLTRPGCRPDWLIGFCTSVVVFVCLGLMARMVYHLGRLLVRRSD